MPQDLIEIPVPPALGPDPIRIHHPEGAFVPTPASRVALRAIGRHADRFRGRGLEWGSGSGILSIAAARISGVEKVLGLELDPRGVAAAAENARRNGSGGQSPVRRVGLPSAGFTAGPEGPGAIPGVGRRHPGESPVVEPRGRRFRSPPGRCPGRPRVPEDGRRPAPQRLHPVQRGARARTRQRESRIRPRGRRGHHRPGKAPIFRSRTISEIATSESGPPRGIPRQRVAWNDGQAARTFGGLATTDSAVSPRSWIGGWLSPEVARLTGVTRAH